MISAGIEVLLCGALCFAGVGFTLSRDYRKVSFYALCLGLTVGVAFWLDGHVWAALSEWLVAGLMTVLLIWFTALVGTERRQPRLFHWIWTGVLSLVLSAGIVMAFLRFSAAKRATLTELGFIETSIGLLALLWLVWIGSVAQSRPEPLETDQT